MSQAGTEPVRSREGTERALSQVKSHCNKRQPKRGFGQSSLLISGHTWSHLVTPGHTWSHLVTPDHIWPHLVTSGHIWPHLVTSVQFRAALEHPQRTGRAPRAAQLSRKSLGNPWQFQLPSPAALPALQGSHSSTCTARGQNPSPGARHGAAEARIQQPALPELGGKPGAGGEL